MKWQIPAFLAAGLAIGTMLAATEPSAQTGDTRAIQVTANVKGSCRFEATPDINFGDLDPLNAAVRNQTVNISFKCTKGVNYTLTVGNGLNYSGGKNRMKGAAGTDYIAYDISPRSQTGSGEGFQTSTSITLTGTVEAVDYQNVAAGAYADTVTLSVQP